MYLNVAQWQRYKRASKSCGVVEIRVYSSKPEGQPLPSLGRLHAFVRSPAGFDAAFDSKAERAAAQNVTPSCRRSLNPTIVKSFSLHLTGHAVSQP